MKKMSLFMGLMVLIGCSSSLLAGVPEPKYSFGFSGNSMCAGTTDISLRGTRDFGPFSKLELTGSVENSSSHRGYVDITLLSKNGGPSVSITLPDNEAGAYMSDYQLVVELKRYTMLSLHYNSGLNDFSFDDKNDSSGKIEILGKKDGYFWGDFSGDLGTKTSGSVVSGTFACKDPGNLSFEGKLPTP